MAKTATETTTKSTRRANTKTSKDGKAKTKRAPSAYNLFVKANMKTWLAEHPGQPVKEAMAEVRLSFRLSLQRLMYARGQIGSMWKNAPENPKRGKDTEAKAKKISSKKKAASVEPPQVEPSSDD
ncbi:hypothetical protein EWM64_g4566 [Hericium alpestre]|uniref:HMG box domain-containing protein n=1 Tax=Hericium alpestre TaxID=135208 RepID=A0A4Y9ZXA7_9AGAM|nr:hypothetical protein EWM64_g4566 [Hericium alpestre]